ncbi:hypothetical protein B0H14DRAFT_2523183 [Mycena olivaceomarginata]|nr:hypothetical protein B0H14DRAFT_2523183 [Mycena olivaceomarginata]
MPGQQLTSQLRDRIISWRYEHHKTAAEIAELAGCSERTVYNVLRWYRDYGQTSNPHARSRGRPRLLDMGDLNYLTALLDANPGLYLDELQACLLDARHVDASMATLSRSCIAGA